MKKIALCISVFILSLPSVAMETDNLSDWFLKGSSRANIKYYYIETNKENSATDLSSSAHANSIGAKLNYTTANFHGLSMGFTLMTTNPFSLPSRVDTSVIGRDNGIRLDSSVSSKTAKDGFSILGESFIKYKNENFELLYGRKVIKSPLIDAKEVRVLPSVVEGSTVLYNFENGVTLGSAYFTKFKQRTSNVFTNIVEHALGSKTKELIGKSGGSVASIYLTNNFKNYKFRIYDYFAKDFMNSIYFDVDKKGKIGSNISYTTSIQGIYQRGVGHSIDTMNNNIDTYGGKINSRAFGVKSKINYDSSTFEVSFTDVLNSSNGEHNSLVMPWDGTPLFTNTITSSNLFGSNYGKGLTSSGGYISGTQGVKFSYVQEYSNSFKSLVSYSRFSNKNFDKTQEDINAVISYKIGDFSISLKGIWVDNSTTIGSSDSKDSISQIDSLRQYRVIANYQF